MHLHTGTWEAMTPRFQARVSERVPRALRWIMPYVTPYTLSGKAILRELDGAGISAGGVFALYSPHSTGIAPNELVAEEIALNPKRLYGFASLRVDQWNVNGPAAAREARVRPAAPRQFRRRQARPRPPANPLRRRALLCDLRNRRAAEEAGLPAHRHQPEPGHTPRAALRGPRLPGGGDPPLPEHHLHPRAHRLRQRAPGADLHGFGAAPCRSVSERLPGARCARRETRRGRARRFPRARQGGRRD